MTDRRFSLQDFKKWLSHQDDMSNFFNLQREEVEEDQYTGHMCRPKVSEKKLIERIECDGDPTELIAEFLEKGGKITCAEGRNFCVETETGAFSIPRFCVKVRKSDSDISDKL